MKQTSMNPFRSLIDRFSAWNSKLRYRSADEVARLLHQIADRSADQGKVDGFIYIPISDPQLERIREQFGAMYGPGFDPTDRTFTQLVEQADALARG
jgi:hypothetical protein